MGRCPPLLQDLRPQRLRLALQPSADMSWPCLGETALGSQVD